MKRDINDLIKFRISRSDGTLKEANALAVIKQWNGVANRLYYAAFYGISALLLKRNIYTKTHSGLKSKFNQEIIKKGVLNLKYGDTYNKLFDFRANGDYGDFVNLEESQIAPLIDLTTQLITEIKKLITDDSFTN